MARRSTEMPTHVPLPSATVGGVPVRKIKCAIGSPLRQDEKFGPELWAAERESKGSSELRVASCGGASQRACQPVLDSRLQRVTFAIERVEGCINRNRHG